MKTINKLNTLFRQSACLLASVYFILFSLPSFAGVKVFGGVVEEDIEIERLYEVREISFTITKTSSEDTFLESGTIKGEVGLDAITGRMIVDIQQIQKSGMAMTAAGYVEASDNQRGIPGCTLWQTRMFEEDKLCYAGKINKGTAVKIILSVDGDPSTPVAGQ